MIKDDIITKIETSASRDRGGIVYLTRSYGGVTLGKYIFVRQDYKDISNIIKHECGHLR